MRAVRCASLLEAIPDLRIRTRHGERLRWIEPVVLPPEGPLTTEMMAIMAGFNKPGVHTAPGRGVLKTEVIPSGKTREGGTGYARGTKTELFLRATTVFAGEGQFYENAAVADERLRTIVRQLAGSNEGYRWLCGFLPWLRASGNIRSAALMLALEAVDARTGIQIPGIPGNSTMLPPEDCLTHRQLIAAVQLRPDEPVEMLAYWMVHKGRRIPKPVKRGIADGATRMWNERAYLRYDKPGKTYRFADVLELCHPKPWWWEVQSDGTRIRVQSEKKRILYRHIITERHSREGYEPPAELEAIRARWELNQLKPENRHALARDVLNNAGTEGNRRKLELAVAGQWEWLQSWLGEKVPADVQSLTKAEQWQLCIPLMGYMAILRNLRNFDKAPITDSLASKVANRISSKEQVEKSRQFPFRFLSAYLNAQGTFRWAQSLEAALKYSLPNIPELPGRTLILIDTSGSMGNMLSSHEERKLKPGQAPPERPRRVEAAALFALATAQRNAGNVDVYCFADGQLKVDGVEEKPLLRGMEVIRDSIGRVGHGTQIEAAVRATYASQDRVLIFTDEQTFGTVSAYSFMRQHIGNVASAVPAHVPVYAFNLAGYEFGSMPAGQANRYELGGLTDATFKMIKQLEDGRDGKWPWEDERPRDVVKDSGRAGDAKELHSSREG